jgi:hypothetical protein
MRLSILFLFITSSAFSQADTTFLTYKDSMFWKVRVTINQDGEVNTNEKPIGKDTAAVINALVSEVYPDYESYAANAFNVLRNYRPILRSINSTSTALSNLTGKTYLTSMSEVLGNEFLGDYVMTTLTGNVDCSIVKLANGTLRFRQGTTNFPIDIISRKWLRIRRYDGRSEITEDTGYVDLFSNGTIFIGSTNMQSVQFTLRKKNN